MGVAEILKITVGLWCGSGGDTEDNSEIMASSGS